MFNKKVKILKIKQETPEVKTLVFDIKRDELDFRPGQYLMVETEVGTRPFSISTSPTRDYIEITIKKYNDSNAASYLHSLNKEDEITLKGPFGRFVLDEDDEKIVFLAAGNGITPIRSMIQYAIDKKLGNNLTLIYSNKTKESIIFYDELRELSNDNENFDAFFTLTKQEWEGLKGRIDKKMIKDHADLDSSFYIVGPNDFIDAEVTLLKELNAKKIQREVFVRSNS